MKKKNVYSQGSYNSLLLTLVCSLFLLGSATQYALATEQSTTESNVPVTDPAQLLAEIYLQFDLKILKQPDDPDAQWRVKLEARDLQKAVELPIELDISGNESPEVGGWRTFRFDMLSITKAGTGINLDSIDKVLIFPTWGKGKGAQYRVDNVHFGMLNSANRETVFDSQEIALWPAWDCCGGTTPEIVVDDDPRRGEAFQFTIESEEGTVLGFNRQIAYGSRPFKISSLPVNAEKLLEGEFVLVTEDAPDNIIFSQLVTEELSSLGAVNAIVKDQQGFMWFGGSDGLARYDGYDLKMFLHDIDDPTSISSNEVWDMLVDAEGRLWVATQHGLNMFDHAKQSFKRYMNDPGNLQSVSHNTTKVLFEDSQGAIWIGTYGGGLNRFDVESDTFTRYQNTPNDPNSLSSNEVNAIYEDHLGVIWIGTEKGLNSFAMDTQTFNSYFYYWGNQSSLTDNTIITIKEDRLNRLWVGAYNGLNLFDRDTGTVTRYKFDDYSLFEVVDIEFDDQNRMLIGTGVGIILFDTETLTFSRYSNNPLSNSSFKGKYAASMFKDGSDWWFGTFPLGINYINYNKNLFTTFEREPDNPNSLGNSSVLSVTEDNVGNLWIGTDGGGLHYYDRQQGIFTRYVKGKDNERSISGDAVLSSAYDADGNLWVTSWNSPLSILDTNTNEFVHQSSFFAGLQVPDSVFLWEVKKDSFGDMWLTTVGDGLIRYDSEAKEYLRYWREDFDEDSPGARVVWTVFEDSNAQLWFGTIDGLVKYDRTDNSFRHWQFEEGNPNSLSNNVVLSINEDATGHLWIGTRGGGLNKFNPATEQFTRFTVAEGLPDNNVAAIVNDNMGDLWVSTFRGLCNFDLDTQTCRNFSDIGGMRANRFNIGAGQRLSSGELVFGGIGGFTLFDPLDIRKQSTAPRVVLTDFQLANRSVDIEASGSPLEKDISLSDRIELNHQQSMFSIEFSALNFFNSNENYYSYFLQGYDKQWHEISHVRRATYTNLDPGEYVFMVKGANSEGIWSDTPTSVKITVLAPPWQSWWAYTIYAFVILSVLGLMTYLQLKKVQERKYLDLALWASGDELWNADLVKKVVFRQNALEYLDRPNFDAWILSDVASSNVHPDDQRLIEQALADHINNKDEYFEFSYRAKNQQGEWIWLLDRGKITSRNIGGIPTRISGTTQNINRLKTAEAELKLLNHELEERVARRTNELNQTNEYLKNTQAKLVESEKQAALATVVVGVSHELNTPSGVAITATSQLKHELLELIEKVDKQKLSNSYFNRFKANALDSIELIGSSLFRSVDIIQSFREISVDKETCISETCNVREVISNSIADAAILFDHDIRSHIDIECDHELEVVTFAKILSTALKHLIVNAEQHAYPTGEEVNIHIKVAVQEKDLMMEVSDNGIGMSKAEVAQLYEPFYTSNRARNIGLGMFVVYNHVNNILGGHITCQSREGEGTQFTLLLPLNLAEMAES